MTSADRERILAVVSLLQNTYSTALVIGEKGATIIGDELGIRL